MTLLSPLQESTVTVIGWSLVHSLWIGVLVAVCAWIVVSMLRGATAQSRYVILLFALISIPAGAITCATRTRIGGDRVAPVVAVGQSENRNIDVTLPDSASQATASGVQVSSHRDLETEAIETRIGAGNSAPQGVSATVHPHSTQPVSLVPVVANCLPWLVCIWMAGVAVLSGRLLLGCVSVRRLSSGTPVSRTVADIAARISRRIRLDRTVRVVESTLADVPATIGFFRPLVLLPVSTLSSLSAKELESILAHELAHIHRGDFLVNVFQTIVDILLFYHPAVWWISRRIRQEREHACDDLAIGVTGSRLQYARALATVAEQAIDNRLVMTANGSQFSQRIQRVLGQRDARQAGSLYVLSAGALVTILIGVALVLFQPTRSTASNANAMVQSGPTAAELMEPISGTALGPDGKPLAGVTVYLRRRPFRYHDHPLELAQVSTGAAGQFAFRDVEMPEITNRHQKGIYPVDVIAMKPGYSIRWKRLTNAQTDISLQLRRESPYSGVLKNDAGDPVASATIRVRNLMSLNTLRKIDVAGGHTPSQNGDSYLDLSESVACISATTNKDGRFVLRGLPNRVGMVLGIDDDRFVDGQWYAATTEEKLPDIRAGELIFPPRPKTVGQIMQRRVRAQLVPIHVSPAEIAVTRGVHVRIRVLDLAAGVPVPGAMVALFDDPSSKSLTDGDGVCDLHRLEPESELRLRVQPPKSSALLGLTAVIPLSSDLHVDRLVRLERGAILSGRVIDMDSRAIVPDATVSFVPEAGSASESMPPVQGTSDQAGDFRLVVPAVTGRVAVSRAPAGYVQPRAARSEQSIETAASVVTASLDEPIDGLKITVKRRPRIPIAFVDADGSPVAVTADVRVFSSSNSYFSSSEEVDDSEEMDVSLLEKSSKPTTAIQILARSADNRLAGFFRSKEIADLQGGVAHRIVLRPTASVRGRVLDKETSAPIPGARISLSVSYTATAGQGVASFTCDKEGQYTFKDLVPGMRYSLGASADGHIALNSIHTRFIADEAESHAIDIALVPEKPKPIADLKPVESPTVDGLAPDKAYATLAENYTKDYAAYRGLLKKHSSDHFTSQIVSLREPTPVYAAALMKLANENVGSAVELRALKWICKAHQIAGTEQRFRHLRTDAAARLLKDYHDRKEIADAVSNIIYGSPDSYAAAQQLMKNPHDEVRGRACFTCAEIVAQRYLDPRRGGHDVLREEAIELYQRVVDDYSEITRWPGKTIGERARNKLFELQKLQIGAAAPEIDGVDLDARPMRLSEFRGKVVVVHYWESGMSFWGRLNAIAKEYKGKPLVIVGVNTDDDRAKAISAVEQQGLAIRHWHDPDRIIHARWSGSWPDTHVIGHDGKILYRGQRRSPKPLEDVLDQAVAAAQQGQSKSDR